MFERKVWPIFAWASGVLFVTMLGLLYVASFVDGRWGGFLFINIVALIGACGAAGGTASEGTTYKVKPRGWRKQRRQTEQAAYVRRLEQELLND